MSKLITAIVNSAALQGISQKALAMRAGIAEASLSRMKRKPSVSSSALERLASSAGLRLALLPATPATTRPAIAPLADALPAHTAAQRFAEKHRQLAWSNPEAAPDVLLRQALTRPDFSVLLDAATAFGLDAVEQQWQALQAEASPEALRAQLGTTRMLRNIRHGYEQASA